VGSRVAAAQVQQLHPVSHFTPQTHQRIWHLNRLLKRLTPMLPRTTVEVDSSQIHSHFPYLHKSNSTLKYLFSASYIEFKSSPNLLLKMVDKPACFSFIEILQRIFILGATFWILINSSMESAVVYLTPFL
jgi:hypothetical protein